MRALAGLDMLQHLAGRRDRPRRCSRCPYPPPILLPFSHRTPAGVLPIGTVHFSVMLRRSNAASLSLSCKADEYRRRIRRIGQMAWRRHDRKPLHQRHAGGVVNVDLIARQTVDHQELAVGAEAQLVRIGDRHALLHLPGIGIEEHHLVSRCIADQQAAAVRAEDQMMRLPQGRDAADFFLRCHVDHADRCATGVDHEGDAASPMLGSTRRRGY